MKSPLIAGLRASRRHRGDVRKNERGVTMVLVAVAMIAIIAMAAWSIDLVTLYLAKEEAQRSADAAALTAARVISVSGITTTASMTDTTDWQSVCGTAGTATLAAQAAGGQNGVGSISPTVITVTYSTVGGTGTGTSDCSGQTAAFAINPLVTVFIQRTALPTFFSRIWGNTGNSVSATATAEVFNPSASENSGTSGAVTPVQPRCVKPWMVPNIDPGNNPNPFVSVTDGAITNPGISFNQSTTGPVIGETFYLLPDCAPGIPCVPQPTGTLPKANVPAGTVNSNLGPPNLEYLPGEAPPVASVAVPACASSAGYQGAVAGCDQSTAYQCGVLIANGNPPNAIDLSENPGGGTGDTATGLACSLTSQSSPPLAGQDVIDTSAYPFKITAGAANPYKIASATQITASNSIVSLPIYDSSGTLTFVNNKANVAIVGFLQVFINSVDSFGNVNVTVLNVAGCGNGATGTNLPVNGSSPVPVRLITSP